ncbi:MAG: hypothetical protein PHO92_01090 [Candidatus Peribacteraceae bacterium]|nr:hypothetical protein [Candidatus Peribacteraceae bacterium]
MYNGDNDDDTKKDEKQEEQYDPESGKYDLGAEIGTRIGEHEEDPSI